MDHFNKTRQFYSNEIAPITEYSTKRRLDILLNFTNNKTVLDLGCVEHEASIEKKSDWWLHSLIKKNAKKVIGVDYDAQAVADLNKLGYDIVQGNVEDFDLHQQFDVVVAGELFEHITNHRSFLECVKKHLNSDGIFVASMPNANSLNYLMQNVVFNHETDAWDHTSFYTPITLSVMLKKCGFTPVKIIRYQPSEIFHHETFLRGLVAKISNTIQQLVCWFKPSLARGLIIVAKPSQ